MKKLMLLITIVFFQTVSFANIVDNSIKAQVSEPTFATVNITNNSEKTICSVTITPDDVDKLGYSLPEGEKIKKGMTYTLRLASGLYSGILLADCNEKPLLFQRNLIIEKQYDLLFGEKEASAIECINYTLSGWAARNSAQYVEERNQYHRALACYRRVGSISGEADTLFDIAMSHLLEGDSNRSLAYFDQVLHIATRIENVAQIGLVLRFRAKIYHLQGHYNQALKDYQEALNIWRQLNEDMNESSTLNNIANVYYTQGKYNSGIILARQALTLARATNNRSSEATSLNIIAESYQGQGHFGDALNTLHQALVIYEELEDNPSQGVALLGIAEIYFNQGRYDEALKSCEQSRTIYQHIESSFGQLGEFDALTLMGLIYTRQKLYDKAEDAYEQAKSITKKAGHYIDESAIFNNMGYLYSSIGNNDLALDYFLQALRSTRELGLPYGEAQALDNIGFIYFQKARYAEALKAYWQAQLLWNKLGDKHGEGTTLFNIGTVYERTENYNTALDYYLKAIDIDEQVRAMAGSDVARANFANSIAPVYDRLIDLQLQHSSSMEEAYWISERARARILLDSLSTGYIELSDHEAAALLAAEQEAYAARQSAQDVLTQARALNPPNPALVTNLETQLIDAEKTYDAALAAIQARQDQLQDLVPGRNNTVLTLAGVQAQLDTQTTLLSYWMLEDKTLAFLITANDFHVVELPDATMDAVDAAVDSLYQWSNPENPHPRPLRNLYQWLVEPLTAYLHTHHIAIIPHQALHYVPFAALTNGKTYFGEQYLLTQLPSASIIPFLNQNEARAEQNRESKAVVLGNPVTTLSALPSAEAEAVDVATLLGATVYTGTAASELQLRTVVSGANILHLAAHGSYNTANALYSAIALATGEDEAYDGLLETHEIFGLPLQGNELVTLSACETNVGAISRGDEVVGLTRAFFFAGSPTVISSLWNVDDSATGALMTAFYQHWKDEGMSKVEALQAAQADVRADPRWASSPFYWAGFVLNGHPGKSHAE